jgi:hypothetical protein
MAHTPDTTGYSSPTNLSLGQVPQVEDPELYKALLDIHNAIETLLMSSDGVNDVLLAFLYKSRAIRQVSASTVFTPEDGILLVDAAAGNVVVTLHSTVGYGGYRAIVKRIDNVPANTVTIIGDGAELIDSRVGGIKVSSQSSYTMSANATSWSII